MSNGSILEYVLANFLFIKKMTENILNKVTLKQEVLCILIAFATNTFTCRFFPRHLSNIGCLDFRVGNRSNASVPSFFFSCIFYKGCVLSLYNINGVYCITYQTFTSLKFTSSHRIFLYANCIVYSGNTQCISTAWKNIVKMGLVPPNPLLVFPLQEIYIYFSFFYLKKKSQSKIFI